MSSTNFSWNMHDQTERPGQPFPKDTHLIIKHRYYEALSLAENKDVLEIGAGHGIGSTLIASKAKTYTAGEYSDENIEYLKTYRKDIHCVKVDAHDMPFEDNSFDVIIALAMIYYLDIDVFLKEVRRVLRPGGKLFFCSSNKEVPGFVPSPFTTKYFTVPELKGVLDKHNFNSEFTGAFQAAGGNIFRSRIRALVKNSAKAFIQALPGGKVLWLRMRNSNQGEKFPLPENVQDIQFELETKKKRLNPDLKDNSHRIIYCNATCQ